MQRTSPRRSVLATGTYDADSHPRVRVLLEGLRAHGWAVEEIVRPLSLDTARRVDMLRRPRELPRLAVALASAWSSLVPALVRRRRGPRPDAVLVGHLGHFDVGLVRLLVRPAPVVLDFLISGTGTADDRGVGGRAKRALLAGLDRFALGRADVVVVDTEENLAALDVGARRKAVVVPVGADERWFDAGAARAARSDGPLSVIFYGLLTPLQGAPVIAEALRELGGAVEATVVGTGQDEAEVDRLLAGVPNVTRLRWVDADRLPGLVAAHDVCLGIVGTSRKAASVVPNKAFQGAAAGCVVVTSDTPPQRRAFDDAAVYVPPGDPGALAAALRGLATEPDVLRDLASRSSSRARGTMSPQACAAPLVAALERLR